MPQSVKRKQLGIYYTPPELTSRIVQYTVEELIAERFADLAVDVRHRTKRRPAQHPARRRSLLARLPRHPAEPENRRSGLRQRRVPVPGLRRAGSTATTKSSATSTSRASRDADELADQSPARSSCSENLYGVDLSPEAVEITQLALWIRSATRAKCSPRSPTTSSTATRWSTTPHVHPAGFDWRERFPDVFPPCSSGPSAEPARARQASRLSPRRANPASIASSAIRPGNG